MQKMMQKKCTDAKTTQKILKKLAKMQKKLQPPK